jgi:drug/metabolite transporter (DMT)-like permease
MFWLIMGLVAAVGDAGVDVVTKRHLTHLSPYGMGMVRVFFALPFLAALMPFMAVPELGSGFWRTIVILIPLEITATLLYMKALRGCHLSLCIPFLAFTPVFLIATGWLFLGETVQGLGIAGIVLITGGSYILSIGNGAPGLLAPVKALIREPGARLMLGVALIYSVSAALYKVAILNSEPLFLGITYPFGYAGGLALGYPVIRSRLGPAWPIPWGWAILAGAFVALSVLSVSQGLAFGPAPYVIAVKRLSLLFSVVLGGLYLRERPFLPRLVGTICMTAGVILIAVLGNK